METISLLTLEGNNLHVPRQGLIVPYPAYGRDIDIPCVLRNGFELDIIRHRTAIINILPQRSDMDILDIVLRRKIYNFTL